MIKSKLAIVAVTQDDDKTLSESTNKQELDAAIKITREKILVLMLLSGANYQQYGEVRNAGHISQDN